MNEKQILRQILIYGVFISGIALPPAKAECVDIDTHPFTSDIIHQPRSLSRQKLPCAPNQYFDLERGRCLGVPGGGSVVKEYHSKSCGKNELKSHCSDPNYYYICKGNIIILAQCPAGKFFANRFQRCAYVNKNTVNVSNVAQEITNVFLNVQLPPCTKVGRFPVPGYNKIFYTCESNGERLFQKSFKCQNGTNYDSETSDCKSEVTEPTTSAAFPTQSNSEQSWSPDTDESKEQSNIETQGIFETTDTPNSEELYPSTLPTSFTEESPTGAEDSTESFAAPALETEETDEIPILNTELNNEEGFLDLATPPLGSIIPEEFEISPTEPTYFIPGSDTIDVQNIDNSNPPTLLISPTIETPSEAENTDTTFGTDITVTSSADSAGSAYSITEGATSNAHVPGLEISSPATLSTTPTDEMSTDTEDTSTTVTYTLPATEIPEDSIQHSTISTYPTSIADESPDVEVPIVEESEPTITPITIASELPVETEITPQTLGIPEDLIPDSIIPTYFTSNVDESPDVEVPIVEESEPTITPITIASELPVETDITPQTLGIPEDLIPDSIIPTYFTSNVDESPKVEVPIVEESETPITSVTIGSEIPAETEITPQTLGIPEDSIPDFIIPTYSTSNVDESPDVEGPIVEESEPTIAPITIASELPVETEITPQTLGIPEDLIPDSIIPTYFTSNVDESPDVEVPIVEESEPTITPITIASELPVETDITPQTLGIPEDSIPDFNIPTYFTSNVDESPDVEVPIVEESEPTITPITIASELPVETEITPQTLGIPEGSIPDFNTPTYFPSNVDESPDVEEPIVEQTEPTVTPITSASELPVETEITPLTLGIPEGSIADVNIPTYFPSNIDESPDVEVPIVEESEPTITPMTIASEIPVETEITPQTLGIPEGSIPDFNIPTYFPSNVDESPDVEVPIVEQSEPTVTPITSASELPVETEITAQTLGIPEGSIPDFNIPTYFPNNVDESPDVEVPMVEQSEPTVTPITSASELPVETEITPQTLGIPEGSIPDFNIPTYFPSNVDESPDVEVPIVEQSEPTVTPITSASELPVETEIAPQTLGIPEDSIPDSTIPTYFTSNVGQFPEADVRNLEQSTPIISPIKIASGIPAETDNTPQTLKIPDVSNVSSSTSTYSTSQVDQSTDVDVPIVKQSEPTITPITIASEIPAETENTPQAQEIPEVSSVSSTTSTSSTSQVDQSTDVDVPIVEYSEPTISPITIVSEPPVEPEITAQTLGILEDSIPDFNIAPYSTSNVDESPDVGVPIVEQSEPTITPITIGSELPVETGITPQTLGILEDSIPDFNIAPYSTSNVDESPDVGVPIVEQSEPTITPITIGSELPVETEITPQTLGIPEGSIPDFNIPTYFPSNVDESPDVEVPIVEQSEPTVTPITIASELPVQTEIAPQTLGIPEDSIPDSTIPTYFTSNVGQFPEADVRNLEQSTPIISPIKIASGIPAETDNTPQTLKIPDVSNVSSSTSTYSTSQVDQSTDVDVPIVKQSEPTITPITIASEIPAETENTPQAQEIPEVSSVSSTTSTSSTSQVDQSTDVDVPIVEYSEPTISPITIVSEPPVEPEITAQTLGILEDSIPDFNIAPYSTSNVDESPDVGVPIVEQSEPTITPITIASELPVETEITPQTLGIPEDLIPDSIIPTYFTSNVDESPDVEVPIVEESEPTITPITIASELPVETDITPQTLGIPEDLIPDSIIPTYFTSNVDESPKVEVPIVEESETPITSVTIGSEIPAETEITPQTLGIPEDSIPDFIIPTYSTSNVDESPDVEGPIVEESEPTIAPITIASELPVETEITPQTLGIPEDLIPDSIIPTYFTSNVDESPDVEVPIVEESEPTITPITIASELPVETDITPQTLGIPEDSIPDFNIPTYFTSNVDESPDVEVPIVEESEPTITPITIASELPVETEITPQTLGIPEGSIPDFNTPTYFPSNVDESPDVEEPIVEQTEPTVTPITSASELPVETEITPLTLGIPEGSIADVNIPTYFPSNIDESPDVEVPIVEESEPTITPMTIASEIPVETEITPQTLGIPEGSIPDFNIPTYFPSNVDESPDVEVPIVEQSEPTVTPITSASELPVETEITAQTLGIPEGSIPDFNIPTYFPNNVDESPDVEVPMVEQSEPTVTPITSASELPVETEITPQTLGIPEGSIPDFNIPTYFPSNVDESPDVEVPIVEQSEPTVTPITSASELPVETEIAPQTLGIPEDSIPDSTIPTYFTSNVGQFPEADVRNLEQSTPIISPIKIASGIPAETDNTPQTLKIPDVSNVSSSTSTYSTSQVDQSTDVDVPIVKQSEPTITPITIASEIPAETENTPQAQEIPEVSSVSSTTSTSSTSQVDQSTDVDVPIVEYSEPTISPITIVSEPPVEPEITAQTLGILEDSIPDFNIAPYSTSNVDESPDVGVPIVEQSEPTITPITIGSELPVETGITPQTLGILEDSIPDFNIAPYSTSNVDESPDVGVPIVEQSEPTITPITIGSELPVETEITPQTLGIPEGSIPDFNIPTYFPSNVDESPDVEVPIVEQSEPTVTPITIASELPVQTEIAPQTLGIPEDSIPDSTIPTYFTSNVGQFPEADVRNLEQSTPIISPIKIASGIPAETDNTPQTLKIPDVSNVSSSTSTYSTSQVDQSTDVDVPIVKQSEPTITPITIASEIPAETENTPQAQEIPEVSSVSSTTSTSSTSQVDQSTDVDVPIVEYSEPTISPITIVSEPPVEPEITAQTLGILEDSIPDFNIAPYSTSNVDESPDVGVPIVEQSEPTITPITIGSELPVETGITPQTLGILEDSIPDFNIAPYSTSNVDESPDVGVPIVEQSEPTITPITIGSELPVETGITPQTLGILEDSIPDSIIPKYFTTNVDESPDIEVPIAEQSEPTITPILIASELPVETVTTPQIFEIPEDSIPDSTIPTYSTSNVDESPDVAVPIVEQSEPTITPITIASELPVETGITPQTLGILEDSVPDLNIPTYSTSNDESPYAEAPIVEQSEPTITPITIASEIPAETENTPQALEIPEVSSVSSSTSTFSTSQVVQSTDVDVPIVKQSDPTISPITIVSEIPVETKNTPQALEIPEVSSVSSTTSTYSTSQVDQSPDVDVRNLEQTTPTIGATTAVFMGAVTDGIEKEPIGFPTSEPTLDGIERDAALAGNTLIFSTTIGFPDIKNAGSTYLSTVSPLPYARHNGMTIQSVTTLHPSSKLESETDSLVTGTQEFKKFITSTITPVTDKIPALKQSETPNQNGDVETADTSAQTFSSSQNSSPEANPIVKPFFNITQIFHAPAHNVASGIFPAGWLFRPCTSNHPNSK